MKQALYTGLLTCSRLLFKALPLVDSLLVISPTGQLSSASDKLVLSGCNMKQTLYIGLSSVSRSAPRMRQSTGLRKQSRVCVPVTGFSANVQCQVYWVAYLQQASVQGPPIGHQRPAQLPTRHQPPAWAGPHGGQTRTAKQKRTGELRQLTGGVACRWLRAEH